MPTPDPPGGAYLTAIVATVEPETNRGAGDRDRDGR
jgi:hypothetical protein